MAPSIDWLSLSWGAVSLLGVAIIVVYLLHYFTSKNPIKIRPFTYFILFVTYFVNFGAIALITIDLYMAFYAQDKNTEPWAPPLYFVITWKVVFWLLQLMSWIVIPVMQDYETSGEFTTLKRLKAAIVSNVIFYSVCGGVLGAIILAVVIYLAVKQKLGSIDITMLAAIAAGTSNALGLILLISFMGWGLVELPRDLWHRASIDKKLLDLQYRASTMTMQLDGAEEKLIKILYSVFDADQRAEPQLRKYVDQMMKLSEPYFSKYKIKPEDAQQSTDKNKNLTYSSLVSLNCKLREAISLVSKVESQWERLKDEAFFLEDLVAARINPRQVIASTLRPARQGGAFATFLSKTEWLWKVHIQKIVVRITSVLFALCSAFVVISELLICVQEIVTLADLRYVQLSPASLLLNWVTTHEYRFWTQNLISMAIISYMAYCAHLTVFRLRIWKLYQLVPHHSNAYSMLFSAMMLTRVMPPLCYNFIRMVKLRRWDKYYPAFAQAMGRGDPVVYFFAFFPIFIVVVIFLAVFRVGDRLMACLAIKKSAFINEDDIREHAEEGKEILKKERLLREKELERTNVVAVAVAGGGGEGAGDDDDDDDDDDGGGEEGTEMNSAAVGAGAGAGGWSRRNPKFSPIPSTNYNYNNYNSGFDDNDRMDADEDNDDDDAYADGDGDGDGDGDDKTLTTATTGSAARARARGGGGGGYSLRSFFSGLIPGGGGGGRGRGRGTGSGINSNKYSSSSSSSSSSNTSNTSNNNNDKAGAGGAESGAGAVRGSSTNSNNSNNNNNNSSSSSCCCRGRSQFALVDDQDEDEDPELNAFMNQLELELKSLKYEDSLNGK